MSGIGKQYPTYEPLRRAFEAHAKEAYGEDYVLADFVMIGYVIDMSESESDRAEYIMATSTGLNHIVDGLVAQVSLFAPNDAEAGDD
jgi:hypothetical protein